MKVGAGATAMGMKWVSVFIRDEYKRVQAEIQGSLRG
jgi:hypothetical protein